MAATKTGFGVSCPHCHDTDGSIALDLNDVQTIRCSGCDEEFSPQQARDMVAAELARWEAVCRWVEMAPTAK